MPKTNHDSLAYFKAQSQDLNVMHVCCTFKIKIIGQNLNRSVSKTRDHIQVKFQMPNPSKEPTAASKSPNKYLKDIDVPCAFKIKIEIQNLENRVIKDQWRYWYKNLDVKPQLGTSSILQSPKSGHKGQGCFLHLQIKMQSQSLEYGSIKDQWKYTMLKNITSESPYNLKLPEGHEKKKSWLNILESFKKAPKYIEPFIWSKFS